MHLGHLIRQVFDLCYRLFFRKTLPVKDLIGTANCHNCFLCKTSPLESGAIDAMMLIASCASCENIRRYVFPNFAGAPDKNMISNTAILMNEDLSADPDIIANFHMSANLDLITDNIMIA